MAADDTPARRAAKRAPAAERAEKFGAWLDPTLIERGIRNVDLETALNNPSYDSGLISNWRQGKTPPSSDAAWDIAIALNLPIPDVLRQAGFDDVAEKVEHVAAQGVHPAPRDPVLQMLEELGAPELTRPFAREYERDLASIRRRYQLETAELRRRLGQAHDEDDEDGEGNAASQ